MEAGRNAKSWAVERMHWDGCQSSSPTPRPDHAVAGQSGIDSSPAFTWSQQIQLLIANLEVDVSCLCSMRCLVFMFLFGCSPLCYITVGHSQHWLSSRWSNPASFHLQHSLVLVYPKITPGTHFQTAVATVNSSFTDMTLLAISPWRQSRRNKWNYWGKICERGRF